MQQANRKAAYPPITRASSSTRSHASNSQNSQPRLVNSRIIYPMNSLSVIASSKPMMIKPP
jgi:hypothetical protein